MIRKHNRRAAKAAFSIAFGVALILGLVAAAPAAVDGAASKSASKATPIIVGTKNFPEQYVLGQLYKQALEAAGFDVQYKENIASTELIDTSLRSGKITMYPEYTGIMLSVTFKKKALPKSAGATYALAKKLYGQRGQTLLAQPGHEAVAQEWVVFDEEDAQRRPVSALYLDLPVLPSSGLKNVVPLGPMPAI